MERTADDIKQRTRKLTCIYNKERLPFECSLSFIISETDSFAYNNAYAFTI